MDQFNREPPTRAPTAAERDAVEAARMLIAERKGEGRHHVAAALIDTDGRVFTALNLESVLPQAARCAEPGVVTMALSAAEPASGLTFIAAVNRRGEVIPPCGLCRELLLDFAPGIEVGIPGGEEFRVAPLVSLLPVAYKLGRRASDG